MAGRRRLLAAAVALLFFAAAPGGGLTGDFQEKQRFQEKDPLERRRLFGPGSSPPTCRGRCGRCFPCQPIHLAVQPGESQPLEYYPEAWRCKCGTKLFMP